MLSVQKQQFFLLPIFDLILISWQLPIGEKLYPVFWLTNQEVLKDLQK
jgi:hypothetical protein